MEGVLGGRDVLAVLPTGYGKSLIYQVAACLSSRPTLVVSPLLALMSDQRAALERCGVPVCTLDSRLRVAERRAALERIAESGTLVVLTTPESLESQDLREVLERRPPGLFCVDEAHCIAEWGHDFRPAYLRLGRARRDLGNPPALALTATATPQVQEQVCARLGLSDPVRVLASPHRPNLRLEAESVSDAARPTRAGELIRRLPRPGIVYCATVRDSAGIGAALAKARIPSAVYHGRLSKAERERAQRLFLDGRRRRVLVATSAFGMGIDKPDLRFVLHYHGPGSLEQYVQEAGRAGRDGKPSRCILLFAPEDIGIQRYLQRQGRVSESGLKRVARALEAWAGEDRAVSIAELALSAGLSQARVRTAAQVLEETGMLARDARRRLWLTVSARELRSATRDFARRERSRERYDEERLERLAEYVETHECRARFIRRYFGEADPPECGRCDRCRVRPPRVRRRRKS